MELRVVRGTECGIGQPASQPANQSTNQPANQAQPNPAHPNFSFFPGEAAETSEPEPERGSAEASEPPKPERGNVERGFHARFPTPLECSYVARWLCGYVAM